MSVVRSLFSARRVTVAASVALALAVTGCVPGFDPLAPQFLASTISQDGGRSYGMTYSGGVLRLAGAPEGGGNTRLVFWPANQHPALDQDVCVTVGSESRSVNQPGLALRMTLTDRGLRAVTVTKNVWGPTTTFNVHQWDTGASADVPPAIEQFQLHDALGNQPLPWRMCAKARGTTLDVLVWPANRPMPAWGDPRYGGSTTLGPNWSTVPGASGWYIGHLQPGDQVTYHSLVPAV